LENNGAIKPDEKKTLRILMAASECVPFIKTGGLADVVGTLSPQLAKMGLDVRVILPFHRMIKETWGEKTRHLFSFSVELGWRSQYVGVEMLELNGVTYYFIDNEYYFGYEIYKGSSREGEQYAFFCRAVLEALGYMDFMPDILHVHDWHTAVIPMLIKTQYAGKPQGSIKTVLTIHSLYYQGKFDFAFISDLLGIESRYNHPEYMENYGTANIMKAGIVFADRLTTVSPTYAKEVMTSYYGEGLDGIIKTRSGDLKGIVNGIDTQEFDPQTDTYIAQSYSAADSGGKQTCKEALMAWLGLAIDPKAPLLAMVTRLTAQKGLDLVMHIFYEMMQEDMGFVVLGTGDRAYEDFFRNMQNAFVQKTVAVIKYDNAIAHQIYAGADFLLMPSKFEPCGISQMIAMRYGTLPIVRATGGLKDTVAPFNRNTGEGNGFSFEHFNAHDMLSTIKYAFGVYHDEPGMAALRQNAMITEVGFEKSARAYTGIYEKLKKA
jgi:starch synthase